MARADPVQSDITRQVLRMTLKRPTMQPGTSLHPGSRSAWVLSSNKLHPQRPTKLKVRCVFHPGVGVHISLFHLFPYPGQHQAVLDGFATAFLIINILLFLSLTVATIMRYWMYPEIWNQMLNHPVQSLYVGCFPMALATIINGLTIEAYQRCVRL